MKLLHDLCILSEQQDDLSRLPKDVITAIRANIRKGAEDLNQKWANALELVHKAYEVEGVQRPTPGMKSAWTQYEENLQYAVQQLATNRGINGDWRMSSSMFHEALHQKTFLVSVNEAQYEVLASNQQEIIDRMNNLGYDVHTKKVLNETQVTFSRWGIKKQSLSIKEV